jgi:hypothetical protein
MYSNTFKAWIQDSFHLPLWQGYARLYEKTKQS